ncbi:rhodanese-like domain-containing protein [Flexithrix dorotheae]|uniref:rhodanese-like domain-containing protein n=1 Tax=Flexithrix dorotheae TaxID=70993 RepID=UPI0003700046|nr:rhodanese-like domain-containing protein [Flexithrix dorotheae]
MFGIFENLFGKKLYNTLSSEEFEAAVKVNKGIVILDVRSKSEFDRDKIPNALNIDIMNPNFKNRVANLDDKKTFYVYCQRGGRSARACRILTKLGFENVNNLKGGLANYSGKII